ncbi:hypothetical protein DPMN_032952 [Dreissena polymorpha]|uniref:Uncharacterized protein n=1 Tax=Dreissena polymorpha TaxID=45954 RepID=A0A9D4M569_DREPO|nr:hypothetical protein DPMN_032952 [Dreissena polymorpha]
MCIEDGVNADNSPREITVFRSYSRMSYPGHCILLLERRGTIIDSELNDALCDNGYGQELISKLPYYMIPNRNLMAACGLEEEQQRTWIATLTEMMDEGPRMILRLPKIRQVLIAHPEPFRWYTRRRTEIELLRLMIMNRMALCMDENGEVDETHVTLQTLHNRENMILREFYLRMSMEGNPCILYVSIMVQYQSSTAAALMASDGGS